jgi:hypothetical protein
MAPADRYLLPPASELKTLSDETIKSIAALAGADNQRANKYAIVGMLCGTVSFLGCLGAYVYLVMQHHEVPAGLVLGTTVLGIVGLMIRGK